MGMLALVVSLLIIAYADALLTCATRTGSCVGDICYSNLKVQEETIGSQGCYNGSVFLPYAGQCFGTSMDQICFCNDMNLCNKKNFLDFPLSMERPRNCDIALIDNPSETELWTDACPGSCGVNYYTGGSYGCLGLPDFDLYTGFLNNSCFGIHYSGDGKQINCECHFSNNCGQTIVAAAETDSSVITCAYGSEMLADDTQRCFGDFCFIREDIVYPGNTVRGCLYEDRNTFNAFLKPGTFSTDAYRTTICDRSLCNLDWQAALSTIVEPVVSGPITVPETATGQNPAGSTADNEAQMMTKQFIETLKKYAFMIKQQMEAVCAKIQSFFRS